MWPFDSKKGDFNKKLADLSNNLKASFSSIKNDFSKVGDWISFLSKKSSEHDEKLEKIEQKLNELLEQKAEAIERVQSFKRSSEPFMPVHERSIAVQSSNLTPIQKKVIMLLLGSGVGMMYEELAKKLNLNIVTVRRHINDIKRAGFDIKEKTESSSQRKVFFLGNEGKKIVIKARKGKKSTQEW